MPPSKKNPKFKRGFKKWSDEKSIELRLKLGLFASSPLCAFELCKHLCIPVFVPNEIKGMSQEQLDILLGSGSSNWSAASIPIGKGKYIIVHNPNHSETRQQSNLMHELAHIICKHEVPAAKKDLGLTGFLRNHDDEQENEAEWFGSCLQLPRPALLFALKNGMTKTQISEKYNASVEMVTYRINVTGVKRQLSYNR